MVSLDGSFLPETSDLTLEGLMGEHDLTCAADKPCRQTFCLTGMAMPAAAAASGGSLVCQSGLLPPRSTRIPTGVSRSA
ncbi:MAG: hypothetical protein R3E03_02085 [Novosphingobium sp.]